VAVAFGPALVGVELLVEAVLQLEGVGWVISGTPTELATMPATRSGWLAANRSDRHTPSWHSPTSTTRSEPVASSTAASSATYASSV
jgi:hypothetical protein